MLGFVFLVIQILIATAAIFGSFFLIRAATRAFGEKKIVKGVGLSLVTLVVVLLAIFFILAVMGGLINASLR